MLGWRPDTTRHHALFRVIRHLGYDAIGIGDNEFVEGEQFLASAIRMYGLPAVTANIHAIDIQDWRQSIPSYRIIHTGDLRIGVIGLGVPEAFALLGPDQRRRIRIDPPDAALRRLLPEVRAQTDLILVLSQGRLPANRDLARRVPGIDVIVGSYSARPLFEPIVEDRTLIVQAGNNGAYVGRLRLVLDRNRQISDYHGELVPLVDDIPDDPDVRPILDDYQNRLRQQTEMAAGQPSDDPAYRGAEVCRTCHETQYEQWRTTAHARAFQSLVADHKDNMPECLFCHTTGYGRPSGYRNPDATPALTDVQCEVCHRVSEHNEQIVTPAEPVTPLICIECHTRIRSPEFRYEDAVARIRH